MDEFSERAEWEDVGHPVEHGDGAVSGVGEAMLVMPDMVGADTLLIDKEVRLADMGDLGEPVQGDAEQGSDAILDHQAGMHAGGQGGDEFEAEFRRSDAREVSRIGKEVPAGLEAGREGVGLFQRVDWHGRGKYEG